MTSPTVLCPNAYRIKVATTPSKLLQEVFEEACLRQGYEPAEYGLQSNKKFLDLSLPIRLCGLSNNATLDLIKREVSANDFATVQVALQGSFGRHMQDFGVTTSLLKILETFSPFAGLDWLCSNEELVVPSIGYMNKTWKGADILSKNTLKSIGIEGGGRALFRYSQINVTSEELTAMRQQTAEDEAKRLALMELFNQSKAENKKREMLDQKYTREVEEREKLRRKEMEKMAAQEQMECEPSAQNVPPTSNPPQSDQPLSRLTQLQNALNTVTNSLDGGISDNLVEQMVQDNGRLRINETLDIQPVVIDPMAFANFKFPDVPILTVGDLAAQQEANIFNVKAPDRRTIIFERTVQIEDEEISDEFFEITTAEAKKHQRELSEQVRQLSQQALLPKAFVEKRNREKKLNAYKHSVIRFRFEQHLFVQAQFLSVESVERLFEFIAGILRPDAPEFNLTLPLNQKLERNKNRDLVDSDLAPVSTLIVQFKDTQSTRAFLKMESVRQCTAEEADTISREWLSTNSNYKPETFTVAAEPETQIKKRNREDAASSDESRPYQPSSSNDPKPKWFKH